MILPVFSLVKEGKQGKVAVMKMVKNLMLGAAVAAGPTGAVADSYGKYETPPYVVEQVIGDVEIRQYAPHIVAEVRVRGDRRRALSAGFRVLAGYIFGDNTAKASVAMTAPVAQSQTIDMTSPVGQVENDGVWTVSFTMPSEWTLETLPVPNAAEIRLREVQGDKQAALIFSGRGTDAAIATAEQQLRATLSDAGIAADGPVSIAFYDDPMTLPWNRRNEVALSLSR